MSSQLLTTLVSLVVLGLLFYFMMRGRGGGMGCCGGNTKPRASLESSDGVSKTSNIPKKDGRCVLAHDLWLLLYAPRGAREDTGIRGIAGDMPQTVSADGTIEAGARVLFQNPFLEALPVIENGRVVGILSRHGLLQVLARLPAGRRRSKPQVVEQIQEHVTREANLAGVATVHFHRVGQLVERLGVREQYSREQKTGSRRFDQHSGIGVDSSSAVNVRTLRSLN